MNKKRSIEDLQDDYDSPEKTTNVIRAKATPLPMNFRNRKAKNPAAHAQVDARVGNHTPVGAVPVQNTLNQGTAEPSIPKKPKTSEGSSTNNAVIDLNDTSEPISPQSNLIEDCQNTLQTTFTLNRSNGIGRLPVPVSVPVQEAVETSDRSSNNSHVEQKHSPSKSEIRKQFESKFNALLDGLARRFMTLENDINDMKKIALNNKTQLDALNLVQTNTSSLIESFKNDVNDKFKKLEEQNPLGFLNETFADPNIETTASGLPKYANSFNFDLDDL